MKLPRFLTPDALAATHDEVRFMFATDAVVTTALGRKNDHFAPDTALDDATVAIAVLRAMEFAKPTDPTQVPNNLKTAIQDYAEMRVSDWARVSGHPASFAAHHALAVSRAQRIVTPLLPIISSLARARRDRMECGSLSPETQFQIGLTMSSQPTRSSLDRVRLASTAAAEALTFAALDAGAAELALFDDQFGTYAAVIADTEAVRDAASCQADDEGVGDVREIYQIVSLAGQIAAAIARGDNLGDLKPAPTMEVIAACLGPRQWRAALDIISGMEETMITIRGLLLSQLHVSAAEVRETFARAISVP